MSNSLTHRSWIAMRHRCNNPSSADWANYGGRGITICARWDSFEAFLEDMGPRPSRRHSIERLDNDRGYEPGNCRWATAAEQGRNTRSTKLEPHEPAQIRWLRSCGYRCAEIAKFFGVSPSTISYLVRGETWSTEQP